MAIEIVDFPIKDGDFPWQNVSSPEGTVIAPIVFRRAAIKVHHRCSLRQRPRCLQGWKRGAEARDSAGPPHFFFTSNMDELDEVDTFQNQSRSVFFET